MNRSYEAVNYYLSILERKSSPLLIKHLLGYRGQASTVVKNVAKNEEELTVFLSSYPGIFQITNYTVLLQPNYLHELDRISAINYYSNIVAQFSPCLGLPINNLFGHRGQAPSYISAVANNPSELRVLLLDYPERFIVKNDTVFLTDSNELIEKAVHYYSNLLKKISPNKEFPIDHLIGYRSQASLDIRSVAKNKKEFIAFFSCHPNVFTVTERLCVVLKATLNNKTINNQSFSQETNENIAVEYYFNILSRISPNSNCPLSRLIGHKRQAPYNVQLVAKNEKDIAMFLSKYPNIFTICENNKCVRLTKSVNTACTPLTTKSVSTVCTPLTTKSVNTACTPLTTKSVNSVCTLPAIPPNGWMDHVLKNTTIINDLTTCQLVCRMVEKENIIVLDCEGYNLGNGIITIIQIGVFSGKIYLFDILKCPDMVIDGGLIQILESENILKIVNYCVNDSINLAKQFRVTLKNVFDVSVAIHVIENNSSSLSYFKAPGLNEICKKYGVPQNNCKDELKDIYKTFPSYWLIRPLSKRMVAYAAQDVASLPYLYKKLLNGLDLDTEYIVRNLSQKLCKK